MINRIFILILTFSSLALSSYGQTTNGRKELKETPSDTINNIIRPNILLIKDKETAISVVEPILFSVYGKENIINERPYECSLNDNYWTISGTLPKGYDVGGTFLIIIDATNSKIIRLIHGK